MITMAAIIIVITVIIITNIVAIKLNFNNSIINIIVIINFVPS